MSKGISDIYLSKGGNESGEGKDKVSKSSKSEKKPKDVKFKEFTSDQVKKLMRRLVDLPPTTNPVTLAKYAYGDMLPLEFLIDRDIISEKTCNSIVYRNQKDIDKVEAYLLHSKGVEVDIDLDRQEAMKSGELDPVKEWLDGDGVVDSKDDTEGTEGVEVTEDGEVAEIISKYELSLENLKQKVKVLEGDLKSKERDIVKAEQEKKALEERIEDMDGAGDSVVLESKIKDLEEEIVKLESELESHSGEDAEDLKSEIEDLESLIETHEKSLKEKGELVEDLEESIKDKEEEIKELKKELESKSVEILELRTELEEYKAGAKDALQDLDSEGALSELESLLSEKFKLEQDELKLKHSKEIDALEVEYKEKVESLELEVSNLEAEVSELDAKIGELELLEGELEGSVDSGVYAELEAKYNELDKDYVSLERDKIKLEKIKLELELEQKELESNLAGLESEYKKEKEELEKSIEELKLDMESEKAKLQEEYEDKLASIGSESAEQVKELESKVGELEELISSYKLEIEEKDAENADLRSEMELEKEKLEVEKEKLELEYKKDREELELEIKELEVSLKAAEDNVEDVKDSMDTKVSEIIDQYDKRLDALDNKYIDRVRELEDIIKDLEDRLFKYEVVGGVSGKVTEDVEEVEGTEEVVGGSEELTRLKKENIDHLTRIGELQKEVKSLKVELREANKDLGVLKDVEELEEYRELYEGLLEDMKESDLKYESKIGKLESKLSEVEDERDKLQEAATNFLSSDVDELSYSVDLGDKALIKFNVVEMPPHFNTFYRSLRMISDEDNAVCDIVVKGESFFDDTLYSDYVRLSDIKGTKYSGGKILVDRLSKSDMNKLSSILEVYDLIIVKDFIMSEVPVVKSENSIEICVCNDADKLRSLGLEVENVISPRDASIVDLSYESRMNRINNDVAKSVYYSEPCRLLLSEVAD